MTEPAKRGPRPKADADRVETRTLSFHPGFIPLLDAEPGKSRGEKIEQRFGYDRERPELGLQRPLTFLETFLAIHG
jgi:hypothetical protein